MTKKIGRKNMRKAKRWNAPVVVRIAQSTPVVNVILILISKSVGLTTDFANGALILSTRKFLGLKN